MRNCWLISREERIRLRHPTPRVHKSPRDRSPARDELAAILRCPSRCAATTEAEKELHAAPDVTPRESAERGGAAMALRHVGTGEEVVSLSGDSQGDILRVFPGVSGDVL